MSRLASCLLLLTVAGTTAASAGSITVTVHDRDGAALEDELVFLRALDVDTSDPQTLFRLRRGYLSNRTNLDGKIHFDGLPAGTYAVDFRSGLRHPMLVSPDDNPFVATPQTVLFEDDEHHELDVELWRGIPVTAFLDLPDSQHSGFRVHFVHPATGFADSVPFPENDNSVQLLLVPGVWDVRVEPEPGYLLIGLEQEKLPLPGHTARIDLAETPRETWLTWIYAAPCELYGSVVEATGKKPAVSVEATLIEPGLWIDAAQRRGGSTYQSVVAAVDPHNGRYEMTLPDGTWEVRPVSPFLAESEPESIELDLAPGTSGRADFTIRLDEGTDGGILPVRVINVRAKSVRGATVEVYDLADPQEVVGTGVSNRRGLAMIGGIDDGNYLVVAGHPDYLESSTEVLEFDSRQHTQAQVKLRDGAEVRVEAFDADGEPLGDVAVTFERQGDPPPVRLQSSAITASKVKKTLTTDPSGRVVGSGFYSGSYLVTAGIAGRTGGDHKNTSALMRLEASGSRSQEIVVDMAENERLEVTVHMQPAADVTATLQCRDSWSLPETADIQIFSVANPENPVLTLEDVMLAGRGREAFVVGPLSQGVYRLAVRPSGFKRWTWAFEAHDTSDATDLQVEPPSGEDDTIDLGLFGVECSPAIDLVPTIADGTSFPDLDEVEIAVRLLDAATGSEKDRGPTVLDGDGRIHLREFPRPPPVHQAEHLRPPVLEISLEHPHLLPTPMQRWTTDLELVRGRFEELVLQVEALGGAISVVGPGTVARLIRADGEKREATFVDRRAEIPSVVPGPYVLHVEGADGQVSREWKDLDVQAGATLELDSSP